MAVDEDKPVVLIHRLPVFKFSFAHRLSNSFSLLDPHHDHPSSSSPSHLLAAVRAVLCVGPPPPVNSHLLDLLPSVECIVGSGVGVDHVDLSLCRRRGIAVSNAGDAFSDDVADYAVGLLIDVLRKVSAADRFVRSKSWLGDFPLASKLGGKRVGIVGLGSIGSRVAKRLTPFGCILSYTSRTEKPSAPYPFHKNLLDLARHNQILILCCSLNRHTHHIVNKEVIAALGETGVIVNIGRGGLIQEEEMVRALVQGNLAGAGLDVFENEPCVPNDLFGLDNVVMSPHRAVLTPDSIKAVEDVVVANLEAWFSTKQLLSPVPYHRDE